MKCATIVSFLLMFTLINVAQSDQICDFSNIDCTIKGAQQAYKTVVSRYPVDPLHLTELNGEGFGVTYQISNGTLEGLSKCEITLAKINPQTSDFEVNWRCPQLLIKHHQDATGTWGPLDIDTHGLLVVTFNDYSITLKGQVGQYEKDRKTYFYIKWYTPEFELKGTVTIDGSQLTGDKTKGEFNQNFINEHLKEGEKILRFPLMETYVAKLVSILGDYLRISPAEEVLPAKINETPK